MFSRLDHPHFPIQLAAQCQAATEGMSQKPREERAEGKADASPQANLAAPNSRLTA